MYNLQHKINQGVNLIYVVFLCSLDIDIMMSPLIYSIYELCITDPRNRQVSRTA